ncbi:transposase [Oceanobacillus sp. CFH 90083]|uniref:transposase n=1 Tax=Oceanobacillus sp. CFH 90083 TaxID=2592336 RepID=UPI001D132D45
METLEKGRNDYPVRAAWNTILAGVVFQHDSMESLRRELNRNAQLLWLYVLEMEIAPPAYVYSQLKKSCIMK